MTKARHVRRLGAAAVVTLAAAASGPWSASARAEPPEELDAEAQRPLLGSVPAVAFSLSESEGTGLVLVSLVRRTEPRGEATRPPTYWVARRTVPRAAAAVSWGDSRTCPAITDGVALLRTVADTSWRSDPSIPPPSDGELVTVWLAQGAQAGGEFVSVRLTGNAGPIAAWARLFMRSTADCWSSENPERRP